MFQGPFQVHQYERRVRQSRAPVYPGSPFRADHTAHRTPQPLVAPADSITLLVRPGAGAPELRDAERAGAAFSPAQPPLPGRSLQD
ncbi:hypothetical protein [Mycobacterium attenuatum]|uniref:hypothetical protein n=1 Tax=Mycobacterium attenuatum TaxID=2341086 RepID=UPI000F02F6A9|nr:hypothetical protein [Mycobacterium attenuatum]VBA57871.1 hypothetical protein LAUMK191_04228 [Mycobacterium attenuatum]VBA60976.1 hypothetical protein LAUMK41_04347 [Mycobacterium attenuatum]